MANREGYPHGEGDYIVSPAIGDRPNPNESWVINGLRFAYMYEPVDNQ